MDLNSSILSTAELIIIWIHLKAFEMLVSYASNQINYISLRFNIFTLHIARVVNSLINWRFKLGFKKSLIGVRETTEREDNT